MGLAGCSSPEKQGLALGSLVPSSVDDGLGACPVRWKLVKNMVDSLGTNPSPPLTNCKVQ